MVGSAISKGFLNFTVLFITDMSLFSFIVVVMIILPVVKHVFTMSVTVSLIDFFNVSKINSVSQMSFNFVYKVSKQYKNPAAPF